jgi:peptide/nickel transport system permease protein
LLVPVWLGITLLAFGLGRLAPGDPARLIAERQLDNQPTPAQIEQVRHEVGLDQPLPIQYVRWVWRALSGDLGRSFKTGGLVLRELTDRFPATFQLAVCGMLVGIALALPLGIVAAVRRGSGVDHISRLMALAGASLPSFWLAFLLIILFAVQLQLLPVAGRDTARHFVLPAFTLGFGLAAPWYLPICAAIAAVAAGLRAATALRAGARRRPNRSA